MFQRSPLPVKQPLPEVIPDQNITLSISPSQAEIIPVSQSYHTECISKPHRINKCYNHEPTDIRFLIICIALLLLLLAVVGFVGFWVISNSDKHNKKPNKTRERFLTNFLYGFGVLTAIVIFFLFYLILR